MLLDLFDAAEADSHSGLFDEQLLDKVLGLWVKLCLVELDLLALLYIIVGLKI